MRWRTHHLHRHRRSALGGGIRPGRYLADTETDRPNDKVHKPIIVYVLAHSLILRFIHFTRRDPPAPATLALATGTGRPSHSLTAIIERVSPLRSHYCSTSSDTIMGCSQSKAAQVEAKENVAPALHAILKGITPNNAPESWAKVTSLCHSNPDDASAVYEGQTPLHLACQKIGIGGAPSLDAM